jgi:hypothetical protein
MSPSVAGFPAAAASIGKWKAGAGNTNAARTHISIAGKGWNSGWRHELTLFSPMAKLHMIDVNSKGLNRASNSNRKKNNSSFGSFYSSVFSLQCF